MRAGGLETHKGGGDATNARTALQRSAMETTSPDPASSSSKAADLRDSGTLPALNDVFKSELSAFLFSCAHPSLNPSSVNVYWGSHFIGFFSSDVSVGTEKFRGLQLCDGFHVHGI